MVRHGLKENINQSRKTRSRINLRHGLDHFLNFVKEKSGNSYKLSEACYIGE